MMPGEIFWTVVAISLAFALHLRGEIELSVLCGITALFYFALGIFSMRGAWTANKTQEANISSKPLLESEVDLKAGKSSASTERPEERQQLDEGGYGGCTIEVTPQESEAEAMDRRLGSFDDKRQKAAAPLLPALRKRLSAHLEALDSASASAPAAVRAAAQNFGVSTAACGVQWRIYLGQRRREFCSDDTLLRYLRARDGDEAAAFEALASTIRWREQHIDPAAWVAKLQASTLDARSAASEMYADADALAGAWAEAPFHSAGRLGGVAEGCNRSEQRKQRGAFRQRRALEACPHPWSPPASAFSLLDPAPACPKCLETPTAHCFSRIGVDRAGRHVVYACAGMCTDKSNVEANSMHMAFELERIFVHNSAPGKIEWIIDFKGDTLFTQLQPR